MGKHSVSARNGKKGQQPVCPSEGHGHDVADLGHEDEEDGDPDEGVADAEHLAGGRLRNDVAVAWLEHGNKLELLTHNCGILRNTLRPLQLT